MSGDVTPYSALVTTEFTDAPKFAATVAQTVQPFADEQALMVAMPSLFDLDTAVGAQLDTLGLWTGVSRYIANTTLNDTDYRRVLRGRIARDHWNGTILGAYAVWDILFQDQNTMVFIIDYQDMSYDLGIVGTPPTATTIALLIGDYVSLRPAGVLIRGYYYPTVAGKLFAWDTENASFGGWDEGAWAAYTPLI